MAAILTVVDATTTAIAEAAAVLRRGGLVAFPTETVYGLGANALDADAVARIFARKGRPATNPVIVHVADAARVASVAADWPDVAARLADAFWPGPLTLVLRKRPEVPDVVTAGGPTVAVRVPNHPVALALLRAADVPLAAPSANRSTQLSPTRAEHVPAGLADLVLDGGPCAGGIESTVLDVTTPTPRLLRPGLVTVAMLEAVVGSVEVVAPTGDGVARSPGQMERHYAPRAVLELADRHRAMALARAGQLVGWVTYTSNDVAGAVVRHLSSDPTGYAAGLYAALHELDAAGVEAILVEPPPQGEEWRAVRDRLRRAAHSDSRTA
ncbi:MAG: L-threonylcarbamoyladenylate synthase [Gemmataceae bacterium]